MLQTQQKKYIKFKKDKKAHLYMFLVTAMLILQASSSTKTDVFANTHYNTPEKTKETYKNKNAHVRKESSPFTRFPALPVLSPYDKHKRKSSPFSLSYKDSSLTSKLGGRNKVYQDFYSKHIDSDDVSHKRSLDTTCSEGEAMLEVEVKTDKSDPHQNRWTLKEIESDSIVWSFDEYDTENKVYYHTKCISNDKGYVFTFFDDSLYFYGYYKILINGIITKEVNVDNLWLTSKETILCIKDEDCQDNLNICVISTCNISNKQCDYNVARSVKYGTFGDKAALTL